MEVFSLYATSQSFIYLTVALRLNENPLLLLFSRWGSKDWKSKTHILPNSLCLLLPSERNFWRDRPKTKTTTKKAGNKEYRWLWIVWFQASQNRANFTSINLVRPAWITVLFLLDLDWLLFFFHTKHYTDLHWSKKVKNYGGAKVEQFEACEESQFVDYHYFAHWLFAQNRILLRSELKPGLFIPEHYLYMH